MKVKGNLVIASNGVEDINLQLKRLNDQGWIAISISSSVRGSAGVHYTVLLESEVDLPK